jgi:hypothetical protein
LSSGFAASCEKEAACMNTNEMTNKNGLVKFFNAGSLVIDN